MNIPREQKKAEAIQRMIQLKINPETVRQFSESDRLSISLGEKAVIVDDAESLARIRWLEEKYDALVYYVIHTFSPMSKMDCYLFVADYRDDWGYERENIKDHKVLAYVHNHTAPDCSEIGYIGVRMIANGCLKRTW